MTPRLNDYPKELWLISHWESHMGCTSQGVVLGSSAPVRSDAVTWVPAHTPLQAKLRTPIPDGPAWLYFHRGILGDPYH